jgi:acyl CoA:acetate/3-ketoacid CoA transferase beta subunit
MLIAAGVCVFGIPEGMTSTRQSENGMRGLGYFPSEGEEDLDLKHRSHAPEIDAAPGQ